MKITEDMRKYAANTVFRRGEASQSEMQQKAKEFAATAVQNT
jgi:hypothetical protein